MTVNDAFQDGPTFETATLRKAVGCVFAFWSLFILIELKKVGGARKEGALD